MGQFKPMVKMMTTEPSVILKLKKGGKVAPPMAKAAASPVAPLAAPAEAGKAPKKPPMAQRMKAMNPNQYAKGGDVKGKQMGGMMAPAARAAMAARARPARPMAGPVSPLTRAALGAMAPDQRATRAAMVRKALTGMKSGGSADGKVAALERELKHHKAMSASKAHGTGDVKMGKAAGYKHGGETVHKAMGGSIEGNEGPFKKTKVVTAGKGKTSGSTGGVRMGNAGGFAAGGVACKADGGTIKAAEIRPANTAKAGKTNTTTGEVKLGNAGGFKHGGSLGKAYATGGNVIDDGKAQKMPRRPVSRPVANTMQSGTFKSGGKVADDMPDEAKIQAHVDRNERAMKAWEQSQKESAESTRNLLPDMARKAVGAVRGLFTSKPPPGSVTKTEKSVTVAPAASAVARKKGGKC